MAEGDLMKALFADEKASGQSARVPTVTRRRREESDPTRRLRQLPRARGELDLVTIRDSRISFDDLLVASDVRQLFAEVHLEFAKEDLLVHHGIRPRRTFLFTGPPGCGKSATAEALADEMGRPFATVNLSTVVSSYLGDTAKNLSAIFESASREPWVLLFDEFDAIGKERADRTDHGELKRVVTAFLQQLDAFIGPSILIAATNHPALLDLAVWRRFDEVLEFSPPSVHEIRALLRLLLRPIPREKKMDVDLVASACNGLTQAEVAKVVSGAYRSQLIMSDQKELSLEALLHAAEGAQRRTAIGGRGGPATP